MYFCFIRQRIQNRQSTILLRNSVIHIAINASVTGLDSFCTGYNVYHRFKRTFGPYSY